jgi:hypothetical protein
MALIDDVKQICDRLAPLGWRDLLRAVTANGLDIRQPTAARLRQELVKDLGAIDRLRPGFEDFSTDGTRAITATNPARSLLYHALASPLVKRDGDGRILHGFATPAELDVLENFIFSLAPVSLPKLIKDGGGAARVAVVVFCAEYRPAKDTVDGRCADLTFSRTGLARVGTSPPRYDPVRRGFWPEDEDDAHGVRVVPARFSAWLAVKKKGRDVRVTPILDNDQAQAKDEPNRDFWVPVHKLFAGPDCVRGMSLNVDLEPKLFNLKLQRIHKTLDTTPLPTGYPYVIRDTAIAAWSKDPDLGLGWLVPVVRKSLVEPAILDGRLLTYRVTPRQVDQFAAVELPGQSEFQEMEINRGPSYVHGRMKVVGGVMHDLNDEVNVVAAMKKEAYEALHYLDFTGEGWIEATVPELTAAGLRTHPGCALVAAPDFFPSSGQYELSEWSRSTEVPEPFRDKLWSVKPTPLSETRLPGNLQLPNSPFVASDVTITAVVAMGPREGARALWPDQPDVARASALPDDAAGVFAPGWDAGVDRLPNNGPAHLAGYALGSPFPEDAKLCAALSTFWPAVAPDVFRTFATPTGNTSGTVAPLTDEEIGQSGDLPWDGIAGPRVVVENGKRFVELTDFLHADYVRQAVENRFSTRLTSRVSVTEYQSRILALSRVYAAVGDLGDIATIRGRWIVLSFRAISTGDGDLQRAQEQAGAVLRGRVYHVQLCDYVPVGERKTVEGRPGLRRFLLADLREYYASASSIRVLAKREGQAKWAAVPSER